MFKLREVVGITRLKNAYDAYVTIILSQYIKFVEQKRIETSKGRSKRPPAKYQIIKKLPTVEEYRELKRANYTQSASSLLNDAYGEIGWLPLVSAGWQMQAGI